jgi:hypothetical protein
MVHEQFLSWLVQFVKLPDDQQKDAVEKIPHDILHQFLQYQHVNGKTKSQTQNDPCSLNYIDVKVEMNEASAEDIQGSKIKDTLLEWSEASIPPESMCQRASLGTVTCSDTLVQSIKSILHESKQADIQNDILLGSRLAELKSVIKAEEHFVGKKFDDVVRHTFKKCPRYVRFCQNSWWKQAY